MRNTKAFLAVLTGMAVAGCGGDGPTAIQPEAEAVFIPGGSGTSGIGQLDPRYPRHVPLSPGAERDLATLRRVTEQYRRFDNAVEDGYSVQITPCLEDPALGGQGFHYGNPGLIDGEVNLLEPELLLYEPRRDGSLRFIGVEYIVPVPLWEGSEPPELMGRHFHLNEELGLYAFHVWPRLHNPAGLFADWNPRVSCRFAEDGET